MNFFVPFVWVRTVKELSLLLSVSFAAAFIVNALSPVGIPLFGNWNPDQGKLSAGGHCAPKTDELQDDEMFTVCVDPNYLIIDARSREDYEAGHIPRAVSLPRSEIDTRLDAFMDRITLDQDIIVYCTGLECHDSHDVASFLKERGYQNVRVYSRGYEGWSAAGKPMKEGVDP